MIKYLYVWTFIVTTLIITIISYKIIKAKQEYYYLKEILLERWTRSKNQS